MNSEIYKEISKYPLFVCKDEQNIRIFRMNEKAHCYITITGVLFLFLFCMVCIAAFIAIGYHFENNRKLNIKQDVVSSQITSI